jgi:hypothetical protein
MADAGPRWRAPLVIVGVTCAVVAALVIVFGGGEAGGPKGAASSSGTVAQAPSAQPPFGGLRSAAPGVATVASASTTVAAKSTVVWPEPSVPIPYKASRDPNFGDPFESDAGLPSDVRVLTTVGAFRLGVTNRSKVRDERAVTAVLRELGGEIDALDRGRSDSYERRVVEYQAVYERYRSKLKPVMDGEFALKGNGWTDTERLELPPAAASASAVNGQPAGSGRAP